ncbi:tetratricopeptide repeat protein [Streptomyces sp. NPDC058372]|uniref:tetratricopeptide repeat protein n=1 Tax=Streptomyces sp. NPDC058372 TaxID=3346464 RepID=UPI003667D574
MSTAGPHGDAPAAARAPGLADQLRAAVRPREEGRPEEARELLVPLCAAHPEDAEPAYQTAWAHDVLGLEAEAVPHYRRALALPGLTSADRRGALLGLGSTYRVLGRAEEAVATLSGGVREFPDDAALRAFLSMALYSAGRPKEALELALILVAETSADPGVAAYGPAIRHYARDLDALS